MARLITGVNDLATIHPLLAEQWHPTKNGEITPDKVTRGSKKKIWWICKNGHTWQAAVSSRTMQGSGCPVCSGYKILPGENDLATYNPLLAEEWHPTKNKYLTPQSVAAGSEKKVWWLGRCGHEWEARIDHRNNGSGCPVCTGRIILQGCNDFATCNPRIAAEWHPLKNGALLPSDVTCFSNKKVWWIGPCGHEWQTTVLRRSNGDNCPFCSGHRILRGYNDLATLNPSLSAEWHPTKNGELTPMMVTIHSGRKVWWRCSCGHEWQSIIANRTKGNGCPACARKNSRKMTSKNRELKSA